MTPQPNHRPALTIGLAALAAAAPALACGSALHANHTQQRETSTDRSSATAETFLADTIRLTSPDRFARAGEAYFSPTADWIIFQAVPKDHPSATSPDPVYAMYVAKLHRNEQGHVTGAQEPIRISPPNSANTCGWFHPTLPGVVLFASTIEPHTPNQDRSNAYQRDSSRYSWEFPETMDIVTRTIPEIVEDQATDPELRSALLSRPDAAKPTPLWTRPGYDAEASWSPDGRFILYTALEPGTNDGDIHLRDLASGKDIPLVTAPGYDGGPFFSPDGKRITYRSDRKGDDLLQVFVADLTFDHRGVPTGITNETQLTNNNHVNWAPYWHPSGDYLAYATSEVSHRNYEVFAVPSRKLSHPTNPHSTPPTTRVTAAQGFDGLPVFSPDASHLMWTAQRDDPSSQIYIARTTRNAPQGLELPKTSARPRAVSITDSNQPIADAIAAATPTARQFLAHINTLASPWLEGRFPGTPGIEVAERYIAHHYEQAGLEPAFTDRTGTPRYFQPFPINLRNNTTVIARNTGAILQGKGSLADRYIIIGAHHDHLGTGSVGSRRGSGQIHEGADDNASGTAMVLILAQALADAYDQLPDDANARSILFTTFSAEEVGLLGARHLANNPPLNLDSTDLMINFDMVGRITNNRISMSGLGTGDALQRLAEPAVNDSPLTVITPETLTARSDHAAFYTKDVPCLFFIIDPFHDDYHTPDDEAWKLNPDGAAHLANLAADITTRVATHPEPIRFSEIEGFAGDQNASPMAGIEVRFGIMPGNYNSNKPGVLIERVSRNTSADNAGVKPGDRLIAWEGQPIQSIREWITMLGAHSPGDEITITVERDGEQIDLPVTLQPRD